MTRYVRKSSESCSLTDKTNPQPSHTPHSPVLRLARSLTHGQALAVPDLMQEHGVAMTIALYVRVMDLHRTIGKLSCRFIE